MNIFHTKLDVTNFVAETVIIGVNAHTVGKLLAGHSW